MKMQRSTSLPSHDDDVTAVVHSGGSQAGSSADTDPPFSHGFLDKDPVSSRARSLYFKVIGGTLFLVLTYVIWGVLPIYWASVYKLYDYTHNLHGWVVVSISSVFAPCFDPNPVVAFRISTVGRLARR